MKTISTGIRCAPRRMFEVILSIAFAFAFILTPTAHADGDLNKVKHIIIVMQENHSFDNYFGALPYAPGSPYHAPKADRSEKRSGDDHDRSYDMKGCSEGDHDCVDGLSCKVNPDGSLTCSNSNLDDDGSTVHAFHDPRRCVVPDLDHSWVGTHHEINFLKPNKTLWDSLSDGFVRVNDATEQIDHGVETPTDDDTMGFYNQDDIPFYYNLAENFAIGDRYFSSVLGPTMPNRSYLMAATSFGHLTTSDIFPPPGGYKPITGTIFDLFDQHGVTWADYFQDAPQGFTFRPATDHHFLPLPVFFTQLATAPDTLPEVIFLDPNFGVAGAANENDEHPPTDIQRGQAYVSKVINAIRFSSIWPDSIVFITYDEHGGSYDHAKPPKAPQGGSRTPDGIAPGQCADLSNPPASLQPGGGAECAANPFSTVDTSVKDAEALCPALALNPTGPYPEDCASFDQLGVRVPFIAVSPFSKPHYVSHTIGDHTSLLALIEKRFLRVKKSDEDDTVTFHLTKRDQHANTLEDLFDFELAPSLHTPVIMALPPASDCTPTPTGGAAGG